MVPSLKLRVKSLAMGVLDSSYIKALVVKSAGLKKIFLFFFRDIFFAGNSVPGKKMAFKASNYVESL